MPLTLDGAISKDDIGQLVELKFDVWVDKKGVTHKDRCGKVFLLISPADEKIVIKTDAGLDKAGLQSANTIVKSVDKNVKVKTMDAAEVKALDDFIADWEAEEAYFKKELKRDDYREEEKGAVLSLKRTLDDQRKYQATEPWFKMASMELKDLEGALKKRLDGDKSAIKTFIATLTAKGGLEKLGQVVAADMFNGNGDRFKPTWAVDPQEKKPDAVTIKGRKFDFKVLINLGNVFLATTEKGIEVSALDFVDPNSRFKDMTAPLAGLEAKANFKWHGRVLADKKLRETFANEIAADLELVLNPKKSKMSPFTKLGRDAGSRIAAGMVTGTLAIKKRLEAKYKPMTGGVKERYDLIAQVK
jgi:hypothetical protein